MLEINIEAQNEQYVSYALCGITYILTALNIVYHCCILSCLPIVCRYKINTLLQLEILTYLSHCSSNIINFSVQCYAECPAEVVKAPTSQPQCASLSCVRVIHLAKFIFNAQVPSNYP